MKKYIISCLLAILLNSITAAPKIILKFDDSKISASYKVSASALIDNLIKKEIKASFGVITLNVDNTASVLLSSYLNTTDTNGDKLFEIWHHGLDHSNTPTFEFRGSAYTFQKNHFNMGDSIIKYNIGVQSHTFGAPYNANDASTIQVLNEKTNYKVMFFPSSDAIPAASTGIISLLNKVDIESATGTPDYNVFLTNYNKYKSTYTDYMVLQAHPNWWPTAKIDIMNQIIDFLIAEGCEFVLPYDYYNSLTLYPPTNLNLSIVSGAKVNLTWSDNTNSEYNYKIERTIDGLNWISIATIPQNSTNYLDTPPTSDSYSYRVYANCGVKSAYSNVVKIGSTNTLLSPLTYENRLQLKAFPNPCVNKTTFSFQLEEPSVVKVDIYRLTGELMKSVFYGELTQGKHQISYDLSEFPSGVYLSRIKTANDVSVARIVVNN